MEYASFDDLFHRLRENDESASLEVVQRFTHRLIAVARRRLGHRLRSKVDPEEVLQSAYQSFFARYDAGQFQLGSWDELWALLVLITVRKCNRRWEFYSAEKRDVTREQAPPDAGDSMRAAPQIISREPTPEDAVLLAESVDMLLAELSERDAKIVTLALSGMSTGEISKQIDRSERTVQRVLERIRTRLLAGDDD